MAKAKIRRAARLREYRLGVKEASGVAWLGGEQFLVVDDERGLFRCTPGEDAERIHSGCGLADLEGVCISTDGQRAYLLVERDGSIWQGELRAGEVGPANELGRLPKLNRARNQGWEGITIAPAGSFGDALEMKSEHLVAVHQVSPRRIGLFSLDSLEQKALWRLPKKARKVVRELNDVAVDARNGHILALSGKAGVIVELRVEGDELGFVRATRIAHAKDDIPEGLTISEDGRVWIVTDGKGRLREIALP